MVKRAPAITEEVTEIMVERITRDLKTAARVLTAQEARYLVDFYYLIQDARMRAFAQDRAMKEVGEPSSFAKWLGENFETLEAQVKRALQAYAEASPVGEWAMRVPGVGPVLAAGLLAHIDIEQAPTVGHIWSFAGLNPEAKWERGEKRPWNARLKVIAWKLGESFVRVSGHENDVYGHIYAERKAQEQERNEKRLFKDQAEAILKAKRIAKDTEAYKWYSQGKLPPAHIHARAKRYATKLFLAHLQAVMYEVKYGKEAPKPYILTQPGHAHYIRPPFWT